jgi:hypothetical protein
MRAILPLLILLACLAASPAAFAAKAPVGIAGIELGEDIQNLTDQLEMNTLGPEWDREYYQRVRIRPRPGIRSGYLTVGACANPGQVLRIKVRYADESEKFFNRLKKAIQKKWNGNPIWRGDPFGTMKTWKWSFTNEEGDSISLILQHYSGEDATYTLGNSIKLGNRTAMQAEEECWDRKAPPEPPPGKDSEALPFEAFLPY